MVRTLQDGFVWWKSQAGLLKTRKAQDQQVMDKFNQEMSFLKGIENELLQKIQTIDEEIIEEQIELKETLKWLEIKNKKALEQFRIKSQRALLKNALYIMEVQSKMPAFYQMVINCGLEKLREYYRKESKSAQTEFIFESKQKQKVFKAVKHEGQR